VKFLFKKVIPLISALVVLIGLGGCGDLSKENQRFAETITRLETRYAPDQRTSVFTVSFTRTNKGIALSGEVDNPDAKRALIEALSPFVKKLTDDVTVLPDVSLGGQSWGVVNVSVANMQKDPVESSELISQAVMGTVVRVLKGYGDWYFVQTPDKYLGWMLGDSFTALTKRDVDSWTSGPKVIVISTYGTVKGEANDHSDPVSDIVEGVVLNNLGRTGAWTKVGLPDGRTGFVPTADVADYESWKVKTKPTLEGIERVARSLLGVPYLWGGTSTKAVDCSGFTKIVYGMNGVQISRDANQQVSEGTAVDPGPRFENLRTGDLLFFGRKARENAPAQVLHVALYLGGGSFIHASGMVKINSLVPTSPLFDPNKVRSFMCARRIISTAPTLSELTIHNN